MKFYLLLGIIILTTLVLAIMYTNKPQTITNTAQEKSGQVRYVALGDSYTIGTGVDESENFPSLLIERLREKNIDIVLTANPAVSGFTTDDVIRFELSVIDTSQPTFVTLLIGANDLAIGMSPETYKRNLQQILDHLQKKLPDKKNIILLTIPDFSLTPVGIQFGRQDVIRSVINQFNAIIHDEGKKRELHVVDLYEVSQFVAKDPGLIGSDGLHPTTEQYEMWVDKILPESEALLRKN